MRTAAVAVLAAAAAGSEQTPLQPEAFPRFAQATAKPSPAATAAGSTGESAWWLPPPAAYPAAGYPAAFASPYGQVPAGLAAGYAAPAAAAYNPLAARAAAYAPYAAYYNRVAAGYPQYSYGYATQPAAAVPGVPGGYTNTYSMYPSSYYRFKQGEAGQDGGAAAASMPRFAQREADMLGAGDASDVAAFAREHGYEARHWSDFAAAGSPAEGAAEGGDAGALDGEASAAGAAASRQHMMAPLPPSLYPASAYSPSQRTHRLKAMQGELEAKMASLRALREKADAAGGGADSAEAKEAAQLAGEISASVRAQMGEPAMPAEEAAAMRERDEAQESTEQHRGSAEKSYLRPQIVETLPKSA